MNNSEESKRIGRRLDELLSQLVNNPTDKSRIFNVAAILKTIINDHLKDNMLLSELNSLKINELHEDYQLEDASMLLKSVIAAAKEKLNGSGIKLSDERASFEKLKHEIENEKMKIQTQAAEIENVKNFVENEKRALIEEQEKFKEFKSKLEFADKRIDFQFIAADNLRYSRLWLASAIVLFLAIIVFVVSLNLDFKQYLEIADKISKIIDPADGSRYRLFVLEISKVVIGHVVLLSIMISGLVFTIKNYNARMHNYVINLHKSNTLKSTISLLNTAKSDQGNDQLLIQACQAIFTHQKTGFSGKDGEIQNPNFISGIIEKVTK